MLFTNLLMEKVMEKYDISCNYINLFFLSSLHIKKDPNLYYHIFFSNEYLDNDTILKIAQIYLKTKIIKNRLETFVRIYKNKKARLYDCNTDLYLNDLDDFDDKYKIIILENKTKYKFRLSNIINYWNESLTHNDALFSKPIALTNPHTNLPISKHNLYNIYFKLLNTGFNIPIFINAFFQCDMNLKVFSYKYYTMLKDKTIDNFIKQTNNIYDKWDQILNMLHEYRKVINYLTFSNFISYSTKISICKNLNNPLNDYLKYKFSCNPITKKNSNISAKKSLKKYLNKYPNFGLNLGEDVIRYIPLAERPRPVIVPPPPPPPPPTPPMPPQIMQPPPPLPIINNPFQPSRQIPRAPPSQSTTPTQNTIRNSLFLFRR